MPWRWMPAMVTARARASPMNSEVLRGPRASRAARSSPPTSSSTRAPVVRSRRRGRATPGRSRLAMISRSRSSSARAGVPDGPATGSLTRTVAPSTRRTLRASTAVSSPPRDSTIRYPETTEPSIQSRPPPFETKWTMLARGQALRGAMVAGGATEDPAAAAVRMEAVLGARGGAGRPEGGHPYRTRRKVKVPNGATAPSKATGAPSRRAIGSRGRASRSREL